MTLITLLTFIRLPSVSFTPIRPSSEAGSLRGVGHHHHGHRPLSSIEEKVNASHILIKHEGS
jgi:NIMA-interacting peptidyl-prolyl cis-trans isomerase 1